MCISLSIFCTTLMMEYLDGPPMNLIRPETYKKLEIEESRPSGSIVLSKEGITNPVKIGSTDDAGQTIDRVIAMKLKYVALIFFE